MIKNGLVFAMESEEVVPAEVTELVPETQAEVETAAAEVTEQVGQVEELETATVDAEADAGTLGDIQEVMAESVESGEGMDETSAAIAEVAVEAICVRLGIRNKTSVLPAMESFGSKSSRLAATKIAMESVGDKIKQIWNAILSALKMVWEKVKSFVVGLLRNRGLLLKHLESLAKRVDGLAADAAPAEKTVKGAAAKAFAIGGKADFGTAKAVLADSGKLMDAISAAAKVSSGLAASLINTEAGADTAKAKGELIAGITKAMEGLGEVGTGKDGSKHYGHLVGGRTVAITSKTEGETAQFNVDLGQTGDKAAEAAEALTKQQMAELIKEAIALVKGLENAQKMEKDLAAVNAACNKVTDSVLKSAAAAEGDKAKAAAMSKAASEVRQLNSLVAKFGASMPGAVFNAAKAAGDYVVACAANFKKAEASKA